MNDIVLLFLNPKNLRKKQKERPETFFPAILDGLLPKQAKIMFFKVVLIKNQFLKPLFQKIQEAEKLR